MNAPAGWYADPQHSALWRYWDGTQWTQHTAPRQPVLPAPVVVAKQSETDAEASRSGMFGGKRPLLIVVGLIVGCLVLAGVLSSTWSGASGGVPEAQSDFVAVAQKWRETYSAASDKSTFDNNEFKANEAEYIKDHAGEQRDNEICALLSGDASFEDWVGTVTDVHEDQGKAGLSMWLPGGDGFVALETSRRADDEVFGASNMISRGSPLFDELTNLREGQKVKVSGTFSPGHSGKGRTQCAGTSNLMYSDDLMSPDFHVTLTAVQGL